MAVVFDNLFWLSDVAFAGGMTMAFNADATKKGLLQAEKFIVGNWVLKKNVPMHLQKAMGDKIATHTYNLIKLVLLFCAGWTLLNNIFATNARSHLVTALYMSYSLLTALVSAHDILLHDDRSLWSKDVKRRHVLFPINLEGSKNFASEMTQEYRNAHIISAKESLFREAPKAGAFMSVALLLYYILPDAALFLGCPMFLLAHNQLNQALNVAIDIFSYHAYNNRFDSVFGNIWGIILNGEAHDNYGKQYQYFVYSFKPLEKVAYQQFYKRARKHGASVKEAKAAYYLGRGAIVMTSLFTLNLLSYEYFGGKGTTLGVIGAMIPYALYYMIHAGVAYHNQGKDDWYDKDLKRGLAALAESVAAGYLFYKPVMDALFKTQA